MALLAAASSAARAHGPQIQVTAEAGKILTHAMFVNEPYNAVLQPFKSAYVLPTVNISGEWLVRPNALSDPGGEADINGPGFAVGFGYDSMNPTIHPFQSGNYTVSFTDGLKRWTGSAFVDAGGTQFRVNKNAVAANTTDSGPFASVTWNINVTSSNAHSGLAFRFLGDGSSSTSPLPNGVYLASMELSHGSLTKSDPYYFLIPRAPGPGDVENAIAALGLPASAVQRVVPEPGSLGLCALALAALAVRRRRAKC
jgi:hypothetical protein